MTLAKPTKSRWSWRGPGGLRAAWSLAMVVWAGFCPGDLLRAGEAALQSSSSPNAATVALEYREVDYPIVNSSASIGWQSGPFKNEPAAAGKIVRGVLNFGSEAGNSISFIWQRNAGKLLLDLNRNQDLTDDAAGTFSTRALEPLNYQTFNNVRLPFHTAQGKCQILVDVNFYDYGSRPQCYLAVRSFWQGKLTLQGRDWQVGIVPNLFDQGVSFERGHLLLRPWEKQNQLFSIYNGSLAAIPFTRKVFFGSHAYQLDLPAGAPDQPARPLLQLAEQPVALGDLKITGKYIQRMLLSGGTYAVVLDQPADTMKVPTGNYDEPSVLLEQGGTIAYCDLNQIHSGKRLSVDNKTPTVLTAGGPLTNSISASRHGQDLRLDYRLIGAGGATYQMATQNRSQPPEFAVFKGGKQIASGKFEFG